LFIFSVLISAQLYQGCKMVGFTGSEVKFLCFKCMEIFIVAD